jgi:hypothetical protein
MEAPVFTYFANKVTKTVTVLALAFLSMFSVGQTSAGPTVPPSPYTLINKYVVGQVRRYSMSLDMTEKMNVGGQTQPINIHMDMSTRTTVQKIRPEDGAAVEQVALAVVDATMNGQPMPVAAMQKSVPTDMTQIVSTSGRVLSMVVAPGQPQLPAFGGNSFGAVALLSEKPVNIGDTWKGTMPFAMMSINMNLQTTLKAMQMESGSLIATLDTTITASPLSPAAAPAVPADQSNAVPGTPATTTSIQNMTGETLTYFDVTAGIVRSTQSKSNMDITTVTNVQGTKVPISIHMAMQMSMNLLPSTN